MATNLAAFAQHLPALPHAAVAQVSHFREQLANVSGAVSIACWVTILLPQLLEQWRLKSADGVAISFLLAWFFGDLANLDGAIIGQLRPGVILLAVWFCFSDTLLVLSYYYYKHMNSSISLQDMENAAAPRTSARPCRRRSRQAAPKTRRRTARRPQALRRCSRSRARPIRPRRLRASLLTGATGC